MPDLRSIDPAPYLNRLTPNVSARKQARPELKWLPIEALRVDHSYQREIGGRGAANVRTIATTFNWIDFAPVVVASVQGGVYAVIDGQHRVTAAAACRLESVPCMIVVADAVRQAQAFEKINAHVTAVTPAQLYAARLAAGDAQAAELGKVCAAAGVTICRYPIPANKMKVGETLAVGRLQNMLQRFGGEVLVAALRCITKTRDGNAGLVRSPMVHALCSVLDAEPPFRKSEKRLLAAMTKFDFAAAFEAAGKRAFAERVGMAPLLIDAIADHLDKHIGSEAA